MHPISHPGGTCRRGDAEVLSLQTALHPAGPHLSEEWCYSALGDEIITATHAITSAVWGAVPVSRRIGCRTHLLALLGRHTRFSNVHQELQSPFGPCKGPCNFIFLPPKHLSIPAQRSEGWNRRLSLYLNDSLFLLSHSFAFMTFIGSLGWPKKFP